jgi:dUTP pyrophosphatase
MIGAFIGVRNAISLALAIIVNLARWCNGTISNEKRVDMEIKVKVLRGDGVPQRAYPGDVCFDLEWRPSATCEAKKLYRCIPARFETGVALELPPGYEAVVRGRSGLALKGVMAHQGTVDTGYRGEIFVVLMHYMIEPVEFTPGDRIAQLAIREVPIVSLIEENELSSTERGERGGGSSGR